MLKWLWQYLASLLRIRTCPPEVEEMMTGAQRDIEALHARERERAVQVITEKNNLEALVAALEKDALALTARVGRARERGDEEEARELEREKAEVEEDIAMKRPALEQVRSAAEAVKAAIRREEERIRQETAERLHQMATWRTSQFDPALLPYSIRPDPLKAGIRLLMTILILLILTLCQFIGK